MPFSTVKLMPGVKSLQTPTLLQANVVASNLIRWKGGLPEKYGGWMNFLNSLFPLDANGNPPPGLPNANSNVIPGIVRDMCAWCDLDLVNHLGVAGSNGLNIYTLDAAAQAIRTDVVTPLYATSTSTSMTFATTADPAGLHTVTITDPNAIVNPYSTVSISCHVSVGGLIIFGQFPIASVISSTKYTIVVPGGATTAATSTPTCVAKFASVAGTELVTVTLPNHGLSQGANFTVQLPTLVPDGAAQQLLLQGYYIVQPPMDANTFTIIAKNVAASTGTAWEGNFAGVPQIIYYVTNPPSQAPAGWGVGGWGGNSPTTFAGWGQGVAPPAPPTQPYPPPSGTIPGVHGDADDWQLANWGSQLISNAINGPMFYWDPTSGLPNSSHMVNGPSAITGFFIGMPEQQIIAYGASTNGVQDPLLVAWCDNANFNVWTASVANQAGTYRLTRGSKIIGGLQGPQQGMLWTDVGLWVMQYIGYPNVFGFNEIAQGCGLIGRHAMAVYGPQVYWMSKDAFWVYTNGAVQRLQCDVWDVVIKNMNMSKDDDGDYLYFHHIRGGANSGYDEVMFFFPSQASTNGENDSWVKYNTVTGEWDYSLSTIQQGMLGATRLPITDWIDNNVYGHPISAMIAPDGANSFLMQHEMGMNAGGGPGQPGPPINWMIQTGFFMLSDGEDKVFVDYMLPDFRWRRWQQPQSVSAQVQITLYTADEPDDPLDRWIAYGPYVVTNATGGIEPRCRGRYFFALIQGNDLGSFVRLGGIKFRFAPDGRN